MESFQQKANSIHQTIKVTINHPDKSLNHKPLVLYMKLWLETKNKVQNLPPPYYAKLIASEYSVHKNTAIADNAKFNILKADLMRMMRNVSRMSNLTGLEGLIRHFVHHIQFSGYNQRDKIRVQRSQV